MSTVSLCLIVKNEEKILEKALNSIYKIADEIIIVDTGSTDKTIEIAKKFTDKIYHFEWIDNFATARNYAQSFATKEYILRWDADWILRDSEVAMKKLQNLKNRDFDGADIVNFNWNLEFSENNLPLRKQINYFFYRNSVFHWESPIHNELIQNNSEFKIKSLDFLDIEVDHFKDPVEKAWRYKQTRNILEKTLQEDSNNLRLSMFYADSLIFDKEYEKAITVLEHNLQLCPENDTGNTALLVEELCFCFINTKQPLKANQLCFEYKNKLEGNTRFCLILADVECLINPKNAIKLYENFLKMELTEDFKKVDFSQERYLIHPNLVLGKLYFQQKKFRKARKHLKIVVQNSLNKEQISKVKPLYFLSFFLQIFG